MRRHDPVRPDRSPLLALTLLVLSGGFGLVHLAWALGWRAGVPAGVPPISERPVFLTYDLVAGALMLAAAGGAVRLLRPHPPRALVVATLVASVAALLRGVPALALDAVALAGGGLPSGIGPAVDLWFSVVGVLGLLLWRVSRPGARRT